MQDSMPPPIPNDQLALTPSHATDVNHGIPYQTQAPPSSLAQWTALTPASPVLPSESSAIDQLGPSSPDHNQTASDTAASFAPLVPSSDVDESSIVVRKRPFPSVKFTSTDLESSQPSSQDTLQERNPLFFPGSSQFPVLPLDDDGNAMGPSQDSDASPAHSAASARSESEDETASKQTTKSSTQNSSAPYRRLTDIASQFAHTLFSSPGMTPRSSFTLRPVANSKLRGLYGQDDEEEEDEDDDSSGSDSDAANKSHIPKGRRAGAGTKKKESGLLALA